MTYWHGNFTPATWTAFKSNGEKALGYRLIRRKSVDLMRKGDRVLAYVVGIARWVGILEVTDETYEDKRAKVHDSKDFPLRVPVKPVVALDMENGIPRDKVIPRLSKPTRSSWRGWIQGSPYAFSEKDGEQIQETIEAAKKKPEALPVPGRLLSWRYMAPERKAKKKSPSRHRADGRVIRYKPRIATSARTKARVAQAAAPVELTSEETKKVLLAFQKGLGTEHFPADMTDKVLSWARKAKASKDTNFGLALDGMANLKMSGRKVLVGVGG